MRRASLLSACALAFVLLPAVSFAQDPAQQPPAAPAQPAAPKLGFTTNAGMLLVQIKPDQTAAFEEMVAKLRTSLSASTDATLKQQGGFRAYKSAEASGGNALYVVLFDPATPGTEYSFLDMFNKTLTPEQQRDPATIEMFKKWAAAFAGMNKLSLTPVGGGM